MSSKQDDNYRRNKKIIKGKRYDSNRKKHFVIDDPNNNYNELSYGAFDINNKEIENLSIPIPENSNSETKTNVPSSYNSLSNSNEEEKEDFTDDYFEPIVYKKK
jgi:hypothetical protein